MIKVVLAMVHSSIEEGDTYEVMFQDDEGRMGHELVVRNDGTMVFEQLSQLTGREE